MTIQSGNNLLRLMRRLRWRRAAPVVVVTAVTGILVVHLIMAAGTPVAFEAESGTLAGSAGVVSVTGQSGSGAVKFAGAAPTPTPTPSPTPSQATNCGTSPHLCGFPDETNSGIMTGATLTKVPSQATSGAGWACSGTNCTGGVTITGNVGSDTSGLELADGITVGVSGSNLTVKNLKLLGVHGQSTDGIWVGPSTNGVVIDHCDVTGGADAIASVSTTRGWNGVHIKNGASNYQVNYCNIKGFAGGIFPEAEKGADVFVGNYVHHILSWDNTNTDHCNDWGLGGGPDDTTSSIVLANNTFWMDHPNCGSTTIAFFNDGAPVKNLHALVYHNLVSGATNCVNYGYGDAFAGPGVPSYIAIEKMHYSTKYGKNCGDNAYAYPPWPINATYGPGGCPTGQANCGGDANSFECMNIWDDGAFAGAGADGGATGQNLDWGPFYPNAMFTLKACPASPPAWVPSPPVGT